MPSVRSTVPGSTPADAEEDLLAPSDAADVPSDADVRGRAATEVEPGLPQLDVDRLAGVSRQTVGRWVRTYRRGSVRGCLPLTTGKDDDPGRIKEVCSTDRVPVRFSLDRGRRSR
jgi:hypothetical protein